MKVTFFFDPIDMEQLAFALQSMGIAVLVTTRPNAKAISGKAKALVEGTLLHLCVEGEDLDWYHYLLLPDIANVDIGDANILVKAAAQKWDEAGYPWEFIATV